MKTLIANREQHPFSAVYIGSEMMTYGAIKVINELRIKVPEEVALVGFDVHDKSGLIMPGITSIRQPENDIGKTVADLVVKRIKEKKNNTFNNIVNQCIVLEPYIEINLSSQ